MQENQNQNKVERVRETVKRSVKKHRLLIIITTLLLGSSIVAAVTLLSQTFPAVGPASMTTMCSTPTALTASPSAVASGSTGHIRFQRGTSFAFETTSGTVGSPAFTLPTGYTALWIFLHSTGSPATCSEGSSASALTAGVPFTFPLATTDYDYCAEFTNAPASGLATFTVIWTSVP